MLVAPVPLIAGISVVLNAFYLSYSLYASFASSQSTASNSINGCNIELSNANIVNTQSRISSQRWQTYHNLTNEGEWCHYPEYQSTFVFDDKQYQNGYLNKHNVTSICRDIYPIEFSISVNNSGYLSVNQCKNNTFQYSTTHSFEDKKSATHGVQLHWPSTYVYVWCNNEPNPAFTSFHAPRPIDPSMWNFTAENVPPNILFLQLDAIAYRRLPMTMPKTYRYLERLNERRTSSSPVKVWKFNKFGVAGSNSPPAFNSMFGHSRGTRHPDNHAWLWRQAKEHGYMTAYAETECASYKHESVGINSTLQHNNPWFDYNWMSMYCGLPEFRFQEKMAYCTRGKAHYRHVLDPLLQTLEYYQSQNRPFFLTSNMLEGHVEQMFPARHMDDDGFVEYLERIVSFPNTITIIHSDHGIHYGKYLSSSVAGTQDHRHPFLYVTSTAKGYDIDQRSLNRLVTPFDLWVTFSHLISGVDFINPINHDEISFIEAPLNTSLDLFRETIPGSRTCQQTAMPAQTCTYSLEMYDNPAYCLCQSPFALVCPIPRTMVFDQWNECTQAWSHPAVFDVEYYSKRYHFNDPCEAVVHWCSTGLHQRVESKPGFTIADHLHTEEDEQQIFRVLQNLVHANDGRDRFGKTTLSYE